MSSVRVKIKRISSHSLNILIIFICVIATIFLCFVLPEIIYDFISANGDAAKFNAIVLLFFIVFTYHVIRYYYIIFMNSVITYSSAKIKISPLFGKSIIINIDDVVSISIKYRTGGEYAIVKYRNNEKIQKAFTYQHPFDHVTGKTIGVQGLLESGSDWDNIYDLKSIVEQKNEGRY